MFNFEGNVTRIEIAGLNGKCKTRVNPFARARFPFWFASLCNNQAASLSVGNLVLHFCGNVRQWIVATIGGAKFQRDRNAEFSTRDPVPKAELIARIRSAVQEVDEVLEKLPANRLMVRYMVQTYNPSGFQAIYHVVEHFSYHLGQFLYVYKLRTGADPGFYRDLSKQ